jgi:CRP/FNR family transcriptional regulator, cyclic AMP receptor protein
MQRAVTHCLRHVSEAVDPEPGSFLAGLDPTEQADLLARGYERSWGVGEVVCSEGDLSTWVVILLSGRVKACAAGLNGAEVLLAIRGVGALLGEVSGIDGGPRSSTLKTLEPVTARVLHADVFNGFLEDHPKATILIMKMLCERWRDADRKRVEFGMLDTTDRVAQRLVELADRYGVVERDAIRISVPLTQEELAGWVGSSREAVSKALRLLRGKGWISTGRKTVIIHDLQSLRRRGA